MRAAPLFTTVSTIGNGTLGTVIANYVQILHGVNCKRAPFLQPMMMPDLQGVPNKMKLPFDDG